MRQIKQKVLTYYEILPYMQINMYKQNKNNEKTFSIISNVHTKYCLKRDFQEWTNVQKEGG